MTEINMGLKYIIVDQITHLLVNTTGSPDDAEEMFQYVDSLFREAKRRGYTCLLVDESRANLRFDLLDSVFRTQFPSLDHLPNQTVHVALLSESHSLELYKFFEGVLKDQSFCFKAFDDRTIAEEWLKSSCHESMHANKTYTYVASKQETYALIELTGTLNTVNDMLVFVGEVIREASAFNTKCLLIDGRDVEMTLDVSQAFKVAQTLGDYIPLLSLRIASVPNMRHMELEKFFETAFRNRSISYRVFDTKKEAAKWLLERECRIEK